MDGVDVETICLIGQLKKVQVKSLLESESRELEVTKSLLNLVHNLVVVGSLPVSQTLRLFLDEHAETVHQLLASTKSLKSKKALLIANIPLVINIASSCPFPVSSSFPKSATRN